MICYFNTINRHSFITISLSAIHNLVYPKIVFIQYVKSREDAVDDDGAQGPPHSRVCDSKWHAHATDFLQYNGSFRYSCAISLIKVWILSFKTGHVSAVDACILLGILTSHGTKITRYISLKLSDPPARRHSRKIVERLTLERLVTWSSVLSHLNQVQALTRSVAISYGVFEVENIPKFLWITGSVSFSLFICVTFSMNNHETP